jgi:NAD(P)-dependent dehydrogenase (short-subunit alcohol dehydrogenase family)
MRIPKLKEASYHGGITTTNAFNMSTYLITGASSGLGLHVATRLASQGGHHLILPLRDPTKARAVASSMAIAGAARVSAPVLDLASLASVKAFLAGLDAHEPGQFDGVLFNAGCQSAQGITFTGDGIETTFAVNHLAHLALMKGLLPRLGSGARVGWTASGTHDPKEAAARLSGFRGARYTSAARLAKADFEPGISVAQACRDAYATSKLCNIVSARAFAHRHPQAATFFSFDPGLMPGTGLAREHGAAARWIWHKVLPRLAPILPGTSTAAASSAILTDLLTGERRPSYNGAYFNHTGRQLEPAAPATELWVAEDLMRGSEALISRVV